MANLESTDKAIQIISDSNQIISKLKHEKKSLDIEDLTITKDTLVIVSLNRNVFYPFGRLRLEKDFRNALPGFKLSNKYYHDKRFGDIKLKRMVNIKSYLTFYKDDETGYYEIVSGLLEGDNLHLTGIGNIGSTFSSVLKQWFISDVTRLLKGIKVIKVVSGVNGIIYYCFFNNNALESIKIQSDYIFK
ncbi:hypothetical protein MUY27_20215 [Mucilaginibacter sp. RS28]|uniref:Uncharacterized protein n=1 Tax=Mucilaginibacter straminoryzae TaxID=2932774 RepID=A0A9X1X963_9SPHI|nr:hypothetical protein [Mucilaginibacter straminoryzae]MCJ8212053.1 hypothetical protein [Mucilaginibacter straminoryzae]